MKSLTESPAVLTVHAGAAGQYILRIADLQYRPLLVSVSKLLPGARSLVVITPSDIKVFDVGVSNDNIENVADREMAGTDTVLDPETIAAIAAESERPLPNATTEDSDAEPAAEPAPVRTRRRPKPESVAGHDESCGRCRGAGKVAIALDNGSASETSCPICKGSGVMRRYGARR